MPRGKRVVPEYTGKAAKIYERVQKLESDLRALINAGGDRFIEIGPGNAVSGFLRKTAKAMGVEVSVASIDSVEDFKKLIG